MYYCHNCENFFTECELEEETIRTGVYAPDGYEEHFSEDVCPHCGSDELEEVNECPICGEPCLPDENFCDDCITTMGTQLLDIVSEWAVRNRADRDDVFDLIDKALSEVMYG